MLPQRRRVRVVLVPPHVVFDVPAGNPFQRGFEKFLPNRRSRQIVLADLIRRAAVAAEIPLRVRRPRSRVNGVAQLLRRQLLARDVDRPEPVELLARVPAADVDRQPIREKAFPLVLPQIAEIALAEGKIAEENNPKDFFEHPQNERTKEFLKKVLNA